MSEQPKKWLKKNLKLLENYQTKLRYQLSSTDPSQVEFCETDQNELNLKRTYQGQTFYYHNQAGALQEAFQWFQQLQLNQTTVLYVYGVGLGYYYEAAQKWLHSHPDHALVFLEEDINVLHRLLETELGYKILTDPQVQLIYFRDLIEDQPLLNELSWTYILCPFTISALKLYTEVNPEGFAKLNHLLSHDAVQKNVLVDEYMQYGIVFFRNFYPNLLELPFASLGNGLFNQFKNVPAIICGAGPSLKKNLSVLKNLTEKALIFAGGSALNALTSQGVIPHFGAGIDPNKGQFERIQSTFNYRIPFFYRNRLFHDALTSLIGPKLYLTGSGGYEAATWFEEQLGIKESGESLDEGHNVVNFCIEIAHALGCNPIILVGVDLAFTDQQTYAPGVVAHTQLHTEQLLKTDDFDSQPVLKKDINGNPVYTLWKWITEAQWISEFAKDHPETTVINATEGGLGFEGIPNETLEEMAKRHLIHSQDLKNHIQTLIQEHSLAHLTVERIATLMNELQNSLKRCLDYFSQLQTELKQLIQIIQHKQPYPESLQTQQTTLIEMEIEQEIGYQFILDVFNTIFIRLQHRKIQELQFSRKKLAGSKKDLKKIDLHLSRIAFLKDVARINIELIQLTLEKKI